MRRTFVVLLGLTLESLGGVPAHSAGTTTADFLNLGIGARNIAMGETGATETSAYSAYWNPAGLARIEGRQFAFTYGSWLENVNYEYAGYAQRTSVGTFGVSLDYVQIPSIDKFDNTGAPTGSSYSPMDLAAIVSYANTFFRLPIGVNLKYLHSNIDNTTASGAAADVGILLSPLLFDRKDISIGVVAQNLGPGMKYVQETDPLPLNFRAGASYRPLEPLTLAFDLNDQKDIGVYANFGVEYALRYSPDLVLSARAGYETDRAGLGGLAGATFGGGIEFERMTFDYALTPFQDLGLTHRISMLVKF